MRSRGVLHERSRSGGESRRRGEHGLDLRQIPADVRTYERGSRRCRNRSPQFSQTGRADGAKGGRPLAEDPLFAARIARDEIALENMKTKNLRVQIGTGSCREKTRQAVEIP